MLAMLLAAPFILGGFLFQMLSRMISKVMPALPVVFITAPGAILLAWSGWLCWCRRSCRSGRMRFWT